MPLTKSIADKLTRLLPAVVPREKHMVGDLLVSGMFLGTAALLRRKHPRAALGAALLGSATLGSALLTDYSGYSRKPISFHLHRNVDLGLASLAAAVPSVLSFDGGRQSKVFVAGAVALTALANMTEFPQLRRDRA